MAQRQATRKFLIKFAALSMIACAIWASEAWSASSIRAARKLPSKLKTSSSAQKTSAGQLVAQNTTVKKSNGLGSIKSAGSNTSTLKTATATPAPAKAFSGSINVAPARSLVDFKDGSMNESIDYTFENEYKFSDLYKIQSKIIYSQDLKESSRNDFADGEFTFTRSAIPLGSVITASPLGLGTLPLAKKSRLDSKFYGALGAGVKWGLAKGTLPSGLSMTLSTAFSRLFHEAQTSVSGAVLNQYTAYQKFVANYSIAAYSFTFVFKHVNGLSYQNNLKESFVMAQEFEYSLNDTWSFLLGHANAGAALKDNGQDSNIQFLNDNSSVVYAGVTWKY